MTYIQSHWNWAVAFCEDTDHAYDCTALVQRLGKRWRNPLTNRIVQIPRIRSRSLWSNYYVNNVDWVFQLQQLNICTDIAASAAYIRCHLGKCSLLIQILKHSPIMTHFAAQTFGHSAGWKKVQSLSWWCFDYCWHMCWFFQNGPL